MSVVEVIELDPSVCVVCETYVVHHLNGKGLCTNDLRCAPPACVVHHGAQGGPF